MFLSRRYREHPAFMVGLREILGAAAGIGAWGLMTGVAMVKSGMSLTEALLITWTVFAGSSQLAALPLLVAGAPMWVVWATAFCVNLRFVVFSAHLRPYLMHMPRGPRLFMGYLITDLTYVFFVRRYPTAGVTDEQRLEQQAYLAGSCALNYVAWMGASMVGVVLANLIPTEWGLGFAGILALVGVGCSLVTNRMRVLSAGVAATAAVVAFALPFRLGIVVAIAVAVLVCLVTESVIKTSTPTKTPKDPHV